MMIQNNKNSIKINNKNSIKINNKNKSKRKK